MKIHYHTDCGFFAGCEKMLVNFWLDKNLRRDYEVTFSYRFTPAYKSSLDSNIVPDFVVYPLRFGSVDPPVMNPPFPFQFLSKFIRVIYRMVLFPIFFLHEVLVSYSLMRKIRPDIVHLNNGNYPGSRSVRAFALGARIADCKSIVFVVNNYAKAYNSIDNWFDLIVDRFVLNSVSIFITGSIAAARHLESVKKLPHTKVRTINNATKQFDIKANPEDVKERLGIEPCFSGIIIGVVALMVERKGHKVLIDALEILNNEYPALDESLNVLFEGDGKLEEALKSQVKAKNLSHLISFIGCESHIGDFINTIDLFVLPSICDEDFPNVVLEAMSLGKAVVASNLAGTPEQITDAETGYLVEPNNPSALALAIGKFINNPGLLKSMGKKGLDHFNENFTPTVAVGRYLELYKSFHTTATYN